MVAFRPTKFSDLAEIAKLHFDAFHHAYAPVLPRAVIKSMTQQRSLERCKQRLAISLESLVAVTETGEIVGFVDGGIYRSERLSSLGELYSLYVHPKWQRKGIGKTLAKKVLSRLSTHGLGPMIAFALVANASAISFYEAIGGTICEQEPGCVSGFAVDQVCVVFPQGESQELRNGAMSERAMVAPLPACKNPGATWADLRAVLQLQRGGARRLRMWWRDDDVYEACAELERCLTTADKLSVPLALSVIPAVATKGVARLIRRSADSSAVQVLQHGFSHKNTNADETRKCEFHVSGPRDSMLYDIKRGSEILHDLFGSRAKGVLAPPWNRLPVELIAALPEVGVSGISCFGRPFSKYVRGSVRQVNVHLDLVDWRSHLFIGEHAALGELSYLVQIFKLGILGDDPIGVLTHHRYSTAGTHDFLEQLITTTTSAGVKWVGAEEAFGAPSAHDGRGPI